jgi:hypothetical protein
MIRPQFSGERATLASNAWREWQALQEPLVPSGLILPMPLFGHVEGSTFGSPVDGFRAISPFPSLWKRTMLPWHCQQPFAASAMLPGIPAAFSASTLSRLARISPARAWWLRENSWYSRSWHRAQSFGVTSRETEKPMWSHAPGFPASA